MRHRRRLAWASVKCHRRLIAPRCCRSNICHHHHLRLSTAATTHLPSPPSTSPALPPLPPPSRHRAPPLVCLVDRQDRRRIIPQRPEPPRMPVLQVGFAPSGSCGVCITALRLTTAALSVGACRHAVAIRRCRCQLSTILTARLVSSSCTGFCVPFCDLASVLKMCRRIVHVGVPRSTMSASDINHLCVERCWLSAAGFTIHTGAQIRQCHHRDGYAVRRRHYHEQ